MPLIVLTGTPCSGKTTRSIELKTYFEEKLKGSGQNVEIISENDAIVQAGYDRNVYFAGKSRSKVKIFPKTKGSHRKNLIFAIILQFRILYQIYKRHIVLIYLAFFRFEKGEGC